MDLTTLSIISFKYESHYINGLCKTSDLVSNNDIKLKSFIEANLSKKYDSYSDYIFIARIPEENKELYNKLLENSNYKLIDFTDIDVLKDLDKKDKKIIYKNLIKRNKCNKEKYNYYVEKFFDAVLEEFNSDMQEYSYDVDDYISTGVVSLKNFEVYDHSESEYWCYVFKTDIVYEKDDIKKVFPCKGWIQHDCKDYDCNYKEMRKYIEDYDRLIDGIIMKNLGYYYDVLN